MSESVAEDVEVRPTTPGVSHWRVLAWLDQTGLPSWQIGISVFLFLALTGIIALVMSAAPNPSMYPNTVAFIAIITFFLILYLESARGWHRDFVEILEFDDSLLSIREYLEPTGSIKVVEVFLALGCASINLSINDVIVPELGFVYYVAGILYWLEYTLVIFFIDFFIRQLRCMIEVCSNIRVSLLEADVYAVLANPMLRFLRLYIFGLCIVFASYTVFTSGELAFGSLMIIVMPFYLPGFFLLTLFMLPYNRIKQRIHVAKSIELNHVHRAIAFDDRAHLRSSLIGDDADRLTKVDLMYYQDRIAKIKELPFTDSIRGMLFFGVLPPLTWVIAALIEIFIEGVI